MALANENLLRLPEGYLFSDIESRVKSYSVTHPGHHLVRLDRGDVTRPLPQVCIEAMMKAVADMSSAETFRGYGPVRGYDFLIDAIIKNDLLPRGLRFSRSEIFISDGAKGDVGNISEILHSDNSIGMTDPTYPVFVECNAMYGRSGMLLSDGKWSGVTYMPCTEDNGFVPEIPASRIDLIYLCFPNNPTGTVLTKAQLKKWVDYALKNETLIIFDSAYSAYVRDKNIPRSIYEIKGARKCAIEIRSYSKTAGFTGLRCGYTIVPKELMATTVSGGTISLNTLWYRHQCTRFNGASYVSQRVAEALYTPEGMEQTRALVDYYLSNAAMMRGFLEQAGMTVYGGENAPYLWLKVPDGMSSSDFFNHLLYEANIVCVPGKGFGPSGEGFVRLASFCAREECEVAMKRFLKHVRLK